MDDDFVPDDFEDILYHADKVKYTVKQGYASELK